MFTCYMFLALPASPLCSSLGVIQQLPKILGSKGHHDPRPLSRDTRIILTPRPHGRTLPTATQHTTTPETVLRLRMFAAVIAPILPSGLHCGLLTKLPSRLPPRMASQDCFPSYLILLSSKQLLEVDVDMFCNCKSTLGL